MAVAAESSTNIGEVAQAMREAQRVTAVCHENPDADTIGAAVAICIMAERLGAKAEPVSADGIPPVFAFLAHVERVQRRPTLDPDLAVVCDAATLERVGRIAREEADWFARARLLNVDHHVSSNLFGDLNLVDPHAAATCEVLLRLVDELGLDLDPELATALLTGIVRDSHGFSDRSTSGDTLRATARLVEAARAILSDLPYPTMALWGKMLARMGQAADGRIVYTTLTLRDLDETATEQHDADGLAEFLARAKGAEVVILLRELGPRETRVSLRTSERVDATGIAARFGGGGHARRAGCTVERHLDAAVPAVIEAATSGLPPA